MTVSYLLVHGLVLLFKHPQGLWQSLIKIIVDTILFFASYGIQRDWVYSDRKTGDKQ